MKPAETRTWCCKALTGIWTGDADGREKRLITTGLLGSIRWWLEVVVRGLGGSACDPSQTKCQDRRHCAVCELFGCTGWARKFRFDVLAASGEIQAEQITAGDTFALRFTPLRPVRDEEWALLDLTLRLIADYGAIGGKTVLKPSDEQNRMNESHHQDYGLFQIENESEREALNAQALQAHLQNKPWQKVGHSEFAWASLENFWFVEGRYLAREAPNGSTFNKVLARDERKTCVDCGQVHNPRQKCPRTRRHPRRHSDRNPYDAVDRWLAGGRSESKKVFSFKNPPRTFGFAKPPVLTFDHMRLRLKGAWPHLKDEDLIEGPAVRKRLLGGSTAGTP